ncbi:hypothetical protein OF83DRAFT_1081301 [Amylostereum chailletii]|nr:hypothetical protein OF83DRAFT_1081301 [Amylostereum chailletii]
MAFQPHVTVLAGGSNCNQPEMTKEHRTLVDNAFEEGHYESGIAILNQVHYPSSLPSKDHVRQLLYIVLYPHSRSSNQDKGGSKTAATKSGAYLIPSPAASSAAMTCLTGFVNSNSPAALLRGLPSHPAIDEHRSPDWVLQLEDDFVTGHDSKVAKEADRFKRCKDCWSMLEESFIPPPSAAIIVGPPSPSKRRQNDMVTYHTPRDANHSLKPIGPEAWPVLHWLLTIFEKDQDETSSKGEKQLVRYSPLLLSQIPPTRSDNGAKWDANVPLEIAFFCLEQEADVRKDMGFRLLSLVRGQSSLSKSAFIKPLL